MLYKLRRRWEGGKFIRSISGILQTPPIEIKNAPWTIFSLVSGADYVTMYLLSLKSFYARLGAGKVTAIVDRAMPDDLRNVLKHHVRGIRLINFEDVDVGTCPKGGCWERLVHLLGHSEHEYAIQLDSDTLAFGRDISEVRHCAENNIPFTLGNSGDFIIPMGDIAATSRAEKTNYIGVVAQRLFDQYPGAGGLKYVQASAGFAGFSKGGFTKAKIEEFSDNLRRMLPHRWDEWGTEQTSSNFAIANSPNAIVLPCPKYANFGPEYQKVGMPNYSFLHFIGTYRYLDSIYSTLGRRVINELAQGDRKLAAAS